MFWNVSSSNYFLVLPLTNHLFCSSSASRMESTSEAGRIQCSKASAALHKVQYPSLSVTSRGYISVKGKESSLETFWVNEGEETNSRGADGDWSLPSSNDSSESSLPSSPLKQATTTTSHPSNETNATSPISPPLGIESLEVSLCPTRERFMFQHCIVQIIYLQIRVFTHIVSRQISIEFFMFAHEK